MNQELDLKATIRNKFNTFNTDTIIDGRILWEDKEAFGFEFYLCDTPATMTCYYDDWEIVRKYES